mgnify:CR=1 FL=1
MSQSKYIFSKLSSDNETWTQYIADKKIPKKHGFHIFSNSMVREMKKMKTDSSESFIYRLDNFLLKIPKNAKYNDNILRSYYIGMNLNNLKWIVPNFVPTLGIFSYGKNIIVSQEYIAGQTLGDIIKKLTFPEFINIFVQILFALEIAQRQYRFCHYDLHMKNIIMKPIKTAYSYTVLIDSKRYNITAEKYIPIIIDFGFASICTDDRTVGSCDCPQFGIFPFLIQGVDMYKFLFHAYAKTTGIMNRQIGSLLLFYGSYDPYRLLAASIDDIPEISKTYLNKVAISLAGTYTPLEFALWIISSPEYTVNIKIFNRDIYFPLYINIQYTENITDEHTLNTYKTIELPNTIFIRDKTAEILNIEIGKKPPKFSIKFTEQMKPYLQYLYTIKEMKLENIYKTFTIEFTNSEHYRVYNEVSFAIDKAERWHRTLTESNTSVELENAISTCYGNFKK